MLVGPESPEIGKGGWPGTAELAAAQPTVHVNLNVTTPRVVCRDARRIQIPSQFISFITGRTPPSSKTHPPIE